MAKLKRKVGRPTNYYPELCEEVIEFFDIEPSRTKKIITTGKNYYMKEEEIEVANPLPHLIDFIRKIGTNSTTIGEWAKKYPEFAESLKTAKLLREKIIEQNGLKGLYNASFAIFDAKNTLGWRDEQHLKSEQQVQIVQVYIPSLTEKEKMIELDTKKVELIEEKAKC